MATKRKETISSVKRKSTPLEDKFILALKENGPFPRYARNARAISGRKFEIDFFFRTYKIGCEIQGGIFIPGSGHTGAGQVRDFDKTNLAQLQGIILLQFASTHLSSAEKRKAVAEQVRKALKQRGWAGA